MKKWIILGSIILILLITITILWVQLDKRTKQWSISENNYKASQYDDNKVKREYKLSIEELRFSNDSAMIRINELLKDNKIKDKKINQLIYSKDSIFKTDTIITKDTIFKDTFFKLDTVIKDLYSKIELSLVYPNKIIISPSFVNERLIVFKWKKETVKPKKCWPLYWFQKKHIICEIEVLDNNPYMKSTNNRFIEIIK